MQRHQLIAVALVLATIVAFEPLRSNGFVSFDDPVYVSSNPHIASGLSAQGFAWAFNVGYTGNWHPLTWLSHMLDVSLWGMDARGHHLTTLALHAANVALLFLLLRRITKATGKSAFVAAAFAVHPLHVESVAWISERKDVLSALFGFLALWTWVGWTQQGGKGRYAAALALYSLGLMAKPMLVSLPILLLLLDHWPLNRTMFGGKESSATTAGRPLVALLKEKIPFFVLAGISCAITVMAQSRGKAVSDLDILPMSLRLANAAYASVSYLAKALWPTNLAFFYPYPQQFTTLNVAACGLFIAGATAFVLLRARSRPWLAVGWLWWIGMLVPVIGILQVGLQSMADRYTYIPLVGLSITFAWGVDEILSRWSFGKTASAALALVVVGGWTVVTRAQTALWKDDLSLYRHAAAVTAPNPIVHQLTGYALSQQQKFEEALAEYREALAINPRFAEVYDDIGGVLEKQGKLEPAIESYRKALEIAPWLSAARLNLANALDAAGRFEEAAPEYEQLLQSGPMMAEAHNTFAIALAQHGRIDEAMAHFSQALKLRPDFVDAYINLGITLVNTGRLSEAIETVREGLRRRPDSAEARDLLDHLLQDQGRSGSAPR